MASFAHSKLLIIVVKIHTVMLIVGGIISVGTGFVIDLLISKVSFVLGYSILRSPVVLSIAGVLVLIVSAGGCTLGNHRIKFLRLILLMTVSVLFMNLVALTLSFMDYDESQNEVDTMLSNSFLKYSDPVMKNSIDKLQEKDHCCGISNYTDWWNLNMTIPASCCSGNVTLCMNNYPYPAGVFLQGCAEVLIHTIQQYLRYFIIIVLSISVCLFVGFLFVLIEYCECCGTYQVLVNVV